MTPMPDAESFAHPLKELDRETQQSRQTMTETHTRPQQTRAPPTDPDGGA